MVPGRDREGTSGWRVTAPSMSVSGHNHSKFAVQAGKGDIPPETPFLVAIFLGFALSHYGPLFFCD